MPKRGKGKIYPVKPMAPDIAARLAAIMAKPKPSKLPAGLNPKWRVKHENINQLWRWDTLESVNF